MGVPGDESEGGGAGHESGATGVSGSGNPCSSVLGMPIPVSPYSLFPRMNFN